MTKARDLANFVAGTNSAITTTQIDDDAVTNAKIANESITINGGAVALGVLDWPKEYIRSVDNYILTGHNRKEAGAYGLKYPELIRNVEHYLSQQLAQFKGRISS